MSLPPPLLRRAVTIPQRPPPTVRTGLRRRPKTTKAKAEAALRIARTLARDTERKVQIFTAQNSDFFVGPFIYNLAQIAQGDGQGDRTGLKVNLERVDLRLRFSSYVQSNASFRAIVFQDLQQAVGTAPPILNLLANSRVTGNYNQINRDRYKILFDQTFDMNANYVGQDMMMDKQVVVTKFAKGGLVSYADATALNVQGNGLYLCLIGDYSVVGGNNTTFALGDAQVTVEALTHFTDL